MQLPPATASAAQYTRFGRYVARRLKRAGLDALATDVLKATRAVKDTSRAADDANDPLQDAFADRDAADDALDAVCQTARTNLAGRSADAARSEPYTLVFPDGAAYYTAAPLDEETTRYETLAHRLHTHVPGDAAIAGWVRAIHHGIKDYKAATDEVSKARVAVAHADDALGRAVAAWRRQGERLYGSLVAEHGKAAAERFFPKVSGRHPAASAGATGDAPPATADDDAVKARKKASE